MGVFYFASLSVCALMYVSFPFFFHPFFFILFPTKMQQHNSVEQRPNRTQVCDHLARNGVGIFVKQCVDLLTRQLKERRKKKRDLLRKKA